MTQTTIRLVDVTPRGPRLADVIDLGRRSKKWLGFLPDAGFGDRARTGTLLAAVANGETVGYILYDLTADRVKIRHLCVAQASRGEGVARALVDEVSARHAQHQGLELSCRRDFPAHDMWPALGFRPVGERRGRSLAGHPLTVWLLDHGHPDLFTVTEPDRELVALDHMVFNDIVLERPQGRESRHLTDDWVIELVELCITDEVYLEIDRCDDGDLRRQLRDQASSFTNLSRSSVPWRALAAQAATLVPGAGPSDHAHVGRAVAGGGAYLVTRDDELLKASERMERALRIVVVRPEGLIGRLDRARSQERYEPKALQGTTISDTAADAGRDQPELTRAFLNYGDGERAKELLEILRPALAAPDSHAVRVFRDSDGRPLGMLVHTERQGEIEVSLMRVSSADRVGDAVGRQLAFLPRQAAAESGAPRVVISDPHPASAVQRALGREGYAPVQDGGWVCRVERGMVSAEGVLGAGENLIEDAARLERDQWPLKVFGAGIPVYMVPIKAVWAEALFDTRLAEQTLFGRSLVLGLSREHVYYRKPRNSGGIAPPARILWYVGGGSVGHPMGHVRAVSQLAETVVGPLRSLYQRFARLGVYTQSQVAKSGDATGRVMALRFTHTELLARPIGLRALTRLYSAAGETFTAPRSPRRTHEHMFCLIYEQSSAYAR